MDAETALVLFGSAQLAQRVLGPTLDYLGEGMKQWAEKRVENIRRIIENADKKLGESADIKVPVPPRVLKGIIDEGSFCEEQVATDYLGGVLASSKTGVSRDDRGATLVALIARLSTYQLRSHYIFYSTAQSLLVGLDENIGDPAARTRHGRIFVPFSVYVPAMEFESGEDPDAILSHVLTGLEAEELIEGMWRFGPVEYLRSVAHGVKEAGIVLQVSLTGIELFLWAHGLGHLGRGTFFDPSQSFETDIPISLQGGSVKIADLKSASD
ncbi:MAG: hypothetical protein ACRDIX_04880 [Actinomycetota bacterium]